MKEILAIIPARGGSKGLPGKNILPLAGKPLLAYAIDSARRCPLMTRVIVSTDSPAIADAALRHGAEVPFLRPSWLAGDKADLGQALDETLRMLEEQGYIPDITMVFFPTSPFRTDGLVRFLTERLLDGYASVATVRPLPPLAETLFAPASSGRLRALTEVGPVPEHPALRPYGILDGSNPRGTRGTYFHRITDPIMLIDIDSGDDFRLAETILDAGLFDFAQPGPQAPPDPPVPAASGPLAPGLTRALLDQQAPDGERLTDRDLLRQALDLGRAHWCRTLVAAGDCRPETLEQLARIDPGNPALAQRLETALTAPPDSDAPLARLLARPEAAANRALDNLLAVAGCLAHDRRRPGLGLGLLRVVVWERVACETFFLHRLIRLCNTSLAADQQAVRMLHGLLPRLLRRAETDPDIGADLGVACGSCRLDEPAVALLGPLLLPALPEPGRLFPMLSALAVCGRAAHRAVQDVFTRSVQARLTRLDYDATQQGMLASLLLRLGLPRAARHLMNALADRSAPLATRVYGLMRVGRAGAARRLTDAVATGTDWAGDIQAAADLARAHLYVGRPAAARRVLDTVDIRRLDTPLRIETYLTLFERSRSIDRLLALCRLHAPDDTPPGPADFGRRFTAALWGHDLPRLLALALRADPALRDDYAFAYWLHHTALWAGDAATAGEAAARLAALPEAHAVNVHLLAAQALLARNKLREALDPLAARCRTMAFQAMNMEHREDIWPAFFEHALVLRHLGEGPKALDVLDACLALEKTPHNPCLGLRRLVLHETGASVATPADIRLFDRLSRAQTAQRSLIAPWLALQAVRLAKHMGDHAGAARLVRTRLVRDPLFAPPARQALAAVPLNRPDVPLAALAQAAQAAFHPHRRDSFWNAQLAADLEDAS